MKRPIILSIMAVLLAPFCFGQIVFETDIYPGSYDGDIVMEDIIVAEAVDSAHMISTGHYNYKQNKKAAAFKAVLHKTDTAGNTVFTKTYQEITGAGASYNTRAFDVEEYASGYLMVGSVQDNGHHGTSVNGGSDIWICKVNSSGSVLNSTRIDLDEFEEAYAIVPKTANRDTFLICGYSTRSDSLTESFVMEIDLSLNVNWLNRMDLRTSVSFPENTVLYDITVDADVIYCVGSITTTSPTNYDGVVTKHNHSGTFLGAYAFNDNSGSNEIFYGVEDDGTDLCIAGMRKKFGGSANEHMTAWSYNKGTDAMNTAVLLRVSYLGGYQHGVGYDIKPYTAGGFSGYFVVGAATPNTGGTTRGILYELDNNFAAVRRQDYVHTANTEIKSMDPYEGNTPYLALSGYFNPSAGYDDGYVLKTDMNGYTTCSDSVLPSSATVTYYRDSLLFDTVTIFEPYNPIMAVDTLLDTLVCYDTVYAPTTRSMQFTIETEVGGISTLTVYPNPVARGEELYFAAADDMAIRKISFYDITGALVAEKRFGRAEGPKTVGLNENYAPGLYFVTVEFEQNGQTKQSSHRIIFR